MERDIADIHIKDGSAYVRFCVCDREGIYTIALDSYPGFDNYKEIDRGHDLGKLLQSACKWATAYRGVPPGKLYIITYRIDASDDEMDTLEWAADTARMTAVNLAKMKRVFNCAGLTRKAIPGIPTLREFRI